MNKMNNLFAQRPNPRVVFFFEKKNFSFCCYLTLTRLSVIVHHHFHLQTKNVPEALAEKEKTQGVLFLVVSRSEGYGYARKDGRVHEQQYTSPDAAAGKEGDN
jgi:hypothetical protein